MTSSISIETLKPHLLPLITVLVVFATVPLVIMPWISQGREDYDTLNQKKDLLSTLTTKANDLEQLDVESSRALLQDTVQPALPAEPDPAGVLGTVEIIARQSNTAVVGVDYANNPATAKNNQSANTNTNANVSGQPNAAAVVAPTVSATVTIEGGYENIVSFVRKAESALRVFNLESLHISKINPDTTDVTASFKVVAPYLPHPEDLGPIESPLPKLTAAETKIIDRVNGYISASYSPTDVKDITGRNNPF